ncbi:hypothetical protein EVA_20311, partial [gut metagenome]
KDEGIAILYIHAHLVGHNTAE